MKYINILYKPLLFVILLFSCDVVEQVPVSQLTDQNFWENEGDAEAGLVAVYDQLQGIASSRLMELGDVRADNLEIPADLGWGVENPGMKDLKENIISPTDGVANWSAYFQGISRVNSVLVNVPNIEFKIESEKDRILGEASFLRALLYFYLVRNWGDVPIILKPYTSVSEEVFTSRSSEEEVYDQIIDDLNKADQVLPVNYNNELKTRIRATKGAVQSLLCNVYLERGYKSYRGADDFQQAAELAQEVINNPNYNLMPTENYANIFTDENSTEVIFKIYYDNSVFETNNLCSRFIPRAYTKSRDYGGDFTLMPSVKISENYEEGDIRLNVIVNQVPDPTAYFDDNFANAPYVGKYLGTIVDEGKLRYSDSDWIIYRLSDVILMRAEALVQSNKTDEAKVLLNQIRERAGLSDTEALTESELLNAIQKERFYELCFEGKRWYDLVRTGLINQILPSHANRILLPVPQSDIDLNPKLTQNPGY